jgi:hypothetical protein
MPAYTHTHTHIHTHTHTHTYIHIHMHTRTHTHTHIHTHTHTHTHTQTHTHTHTLRYMEADSGARTERAAAAGGPIKERKRRSTDQGTDGDEGASAAKVIKGGPVKAADTSILKLLQEQHEKFSADIAALNARVTALEK